MEKIEKTDAILKFTALDVHHDHKSGSLRKIFVIFGSIFIVYAYPPCLYNPLILFEFIFSGFLTLNPKIILSRYLQYNIIKTGIFKRQCELNLAYLKRSTDVLPNVFHYTNWFIYSKYFSLKKNWNHSQFYFQNAPLKFSTSLVCFWLLSY